MSKMPAALSSRQGVVPELPGTLHMEPGKLRKRRLSTVDDAADLIDGPFLDIFVCWSDLPVNF